MDWTSPVSVESRLLLPDIGMERRLEGCGAFVAQARMPPARIIEAFDIFANGFGCLPAGRVRRPPDKLGLDRLERKRCPLPTLTV
jgi:hypothetical protein